MIKKHIEVEFWLLPTEHGGRKTAIASGYRPQFYYDGCDWDAQYELVDGYVAPGSKSIAYLTFMTPEAHVGKVHTGLPFLIREGNRVIGYGIVSKLVELPAETRSSNCANCRHGDHSGTRCYWETPGGDLIGQGCACDEYKACAHPKDKRGKNSFGNDICLVCNQHEYIGKRRKEYLCGCMWEITFEGVWERTKTCSNMCERLL